MVMIVAFIAACLIVGYLLGTISTAYIVGKKNNIDIREHGSKNAGTTNAMRTMGKTAGIIVFLGDCIKAVLAILIMLALGMLLKIDIDPETVKLATGFGAVLGHNFPFWMGFKGGKGIAVTGAVIIAFCFDKSNFLCIIALIALFALIVKTTKYVSLGSLAVVTAFLGYVAIKFNTHAAYVRLLVFTLLFTVLAYIMHRQNIVRLIKGTENKIGQKKNNSTVNQNGQMMNNGMNMNQNGQMMNNGMNMNQNGQMMNNGMNMNQNGQMMNNGMNMNQNGQMMNNGMNMNQNGQMMNNGMNMNQNGQMMNNGMNMNGNVQGSVSSNNMFLEPSDLVDGNICDTNNRKYNDKQTEQLYNTGYFDGVRNQNDNTNEAVNKDNKSYYQGYESCDTLDETRQMSETELLDNEQDSFNTTKSYYDR